ncbi:MAG: rubredoxin [Chitinophagaceae bacterium]|nr:rubredoxin [Chitinophagaceae bacterium]
MREKSEVFSSVLIRRKPLFKIGRIGFLYFYDILCARDFNPNERTGFVFSRYNTKFLLPEQLRRVINAFYTHQAKNFSQPEGKSTKKETDRKSEKKEYVHQCKYCLSVYDEKEGEPDKGIPAGTAFDQLPEGYACPLCEAPAEDFMKTEKIKLGLQPI